MRAIQRDPRVAPVEPGRSGVGGSTNVGVEREDPPLPVEQIERLDGAKRVRVGRDGPIVRAGAVDAMPNGGEITISTAAADDGVAVRIVGSDAGSRMRAEMLDRTIEPFSQRSPSGKGTSLG